MTRLRGSFKRIATAGVVVVLSLVGCELVLQAAAFVSPRVKYLVSPPWSRNQIDDPQLGYRMSPYYPGHDERGYRNDDVRVEYDVLAIGDSMTYGFGTAAEHSWPRVLRTLSGRTVYNAGVGGYGPCEYTLVAQELTLLRPSIVVVGIYVGNDLADGYRSVYLDGRCPWLRSADPARVTALESAERDRPMRDLVRPYEDAPPREPGNVVKRTALYGLLRSAAFQWATQGSQPFREGSEDTFEASAARPHRRALRTPAAFRTVFRAPELDALAVNVDDPRLAAGLESLFAALNWLKDHLAPTGARLIVAVLHNKPFVLAERLAEGDPALHDAYRTVVEGEQNVTDQVTAWLARSGIAHVDTAGPLRDAVRGGTMPFASSDDHHPNAEGYRIIAEAILTVLER